MSVASTTFEQLVRELGAKRAGPGQYMARCIADGHKDTTPSLAIRIGRNGLPLFRCHGGCSQAAILAALKNRNLRCDERRPPTLDVAPSAAERSAKALACWTTSSSAVSTLVETYLRSRCIDIVPPPTLRFASELWHAESRERHPALVAAVSRWPNRSVVGVHRIYLRRDGTGKANVPPKTAKKSLGTVAGGAVRLAPVGARLGIAEGIEDALSYALSHDPTLPCWAVLGTANFSRVSLPDLPLAAEITIIADNDATGLKEAHAAAQRFRAEGRRVHIATPVAGCKDFNEERQKGHHT
ncbi:MAG: toprim domain-containing protein [Deltaproteobacteria bacterium]|nr:toprim domain-containing protein [Deltaproteobacteria bacterium]